MTRWGLLVEQNLGYGHGGRTWSAGVLGHVDGTRDEALAELRRRAERFEPLHPAKPKRRVLYRDGDGFLLVLDGMWEAFHCRFTVAEQLYDSAALKPLPNPPPSRNSRHLRRRSPRPRRRRGTRTCPNAPSGSAGRASRKTPRGTTKG
ncbi:hypothetical protein [Streptomyces sp. ISL-87]|uniref:hypothetical protein n=1 Tax=unclassified Streptomyces TaxID=2593676 RepID=UPI0035ABFA99